MEPNHNIAGPPSELPQPQEAGNNSFPEAGVSQFAETRGMRPVAPAGNSTQISNPQINDNVNDPQTISSAVPQSQNLNPAQSTMIADDADLIEKEWVMRAKFIVTQTKDDPHLQNNQMNQVKADYMKKRYNKDLKVSEG